MFLSTAVLLIIVNLIEKHFIYNVLLCQENLVFLTEGCMVNRRKKKKEIN